MYKSRIEPHWFADNSHFWYRNDLPRGRREFILVNAVEGQRREAFDHQRLAQALQAVGVEDCEPDRLPIDWLDFDLPERKLVLLVAGDAWQCDLETYTLQPGDTQEGGPHDGLAPRVPPNVPRASTRTGPETTLNFVNETESELRLFWLDANGRQRSYGTLAAGRHREQHTYAGHVWQVTDSNGKLLAVFEATEMPARAIVAGAAADYESQDRGARGRRRPSRPQQESPDGKWRALVKDHNVVLQAQDGDQEIQISEDGTPEHHYTMLQWAPDGKTLVAFRVQPGEIQDVYLIESSPRGGGRARLRTRPYALPGDKFSVYEMNLFDVAAREQVKPAVDPIDFGRPRLHWAQDGRHVAYELVDRGHQRFRLVQIDTHTGAVRNLIDERSETFIWTAHTESLRLQHVHWLAETDELIYASERDGWRHLYLVDASTGAIKNQITKGQYVVRGIDRIDEQARQIWFHACGRNPKQDPYLIHYYRVGFDGTGLVALTEGNGHHSIRYSPDRKFLIDSYSRVDMPPVHELRRVADGQLVCTLEQADISELKAHGWRAPEVFVAKGRDGKTDIWGIICRPGKLEPGKRYPVIENIYAGPQSAYVPKTFSRSRRYASLTDLGFVVVKIDGMGTAHRSKKFHDVCWQNLKDAGFPDRIRWMKAAAQKYPFMDIERVGVYGTSAGGQNAAAALLFHPDFYQVAVASCGCHDNRMDKASWNEQWMGYPVGPQYAACSNVENAHRLQGHLLLIVGELDTNVPPESTMRFVDALIKAEKDFELLVIPGAGHGNGGPYGQRRMRDFFVRHLQTRESSDRD